MGLLEELAEAEDLEEFAEAEGRCSRHVRQSVVLHGPASDVELATPD